MTSKLRAQLECRHLQEGRRPWVHEYLWKFRRTHGWTANIGTDIRQIPYSTIIFKFWKIRFKNQVTTCSDFSSETMLWINEVEMIDSFDGQKSSRSVYGKDLPNFEMLDAKIASALNKIIQNFQFKKKVSLEEQKAKKEDRFLRGRQIAYMIYEYFRVTGAHDAVLDYADLFSVILHDDNIQEFDPRWDEVLLSMSKKTSMISWKVKNWRPWWKGKKIRNFDYETLTPDTGKWNRSSGQES